MATPIPLIGQPQQQPQFPAVGVQLVPQGMIVNIQLGPTTAIQQIIDANAMDQIAKQWREQRKNAQDILHAVQNTKL